MIEDLSKEQLAGILETIPLEITFVDENDLVKFWNTPGTRIFERPDSARNKSVQHCHNERNLDKVNHILSDLKSGKQLSADFWIDRRGRKIYIRYFAVRGKSGRYLGTLEVAQDVTDIQKSEGEKGSGILKEETDETKRDKTRR